MSVYSRDIITNNLQLIKNVYLNSGVDNIELDNQGNLWIASHPQMLAFSRHMSNEDKLSPSQVIKISINDSNDVSEEVYLNDGNLLSGSSGAAIYKNHLLIGSVFEEHFLHCRIKN